MADIAAVRSWLLGVEAPERGVIRVDAIPLYPSATVYTYRLTSTLPNAPMAEDRPEAFETPDAVLDGVLALLAPHIRVVGVYPRGGELREAMGRAFLGLESGATEGYDLRTLLQWVVAAVHRQVTDLVSRGVVPALDQYDVSGALRYFAVASIVGIPVDFDPHSHLDVLPTALLQQLSSIESMFVALYRAEFSRRMKELRGWECTRISATEIRVVTQPLEPPQV